jgi:nicotinate-nucleotide pyrophosphorylase (carboxylating)
LIGIGGYKSIGHQNLCGMLTSELERFVGEDLGEWDDSSSLVLDIGAKALVIANENCIISGLAEAAEIFAYFHLHAVPLYDDGEYVPAGARVLSARGSARSVLQAERVALNFMARMSGISTLTRECVLATGGRVRIAATRKTTPGFRVFEKKAVFLGGGDTHRFNLSDAVLIKDNHIKILGLEECLRRARARASFTKKIEVEVENQGDMIIAAQGGADIIMFDNMAPEEIARGVEQLREKGLRSRVLLEASGGITPDNLQEYAACGVDVVSLGALTRNARWIDLSLEMEREDEIKLK